MDLGTEQVEDGTAGQQKTTASNHTEHEEEKELDDQFTFLFAETSFNRFVTANAQVDRTRGATAPVAHTAYIEERATCPYQNVLWEGGVGEKENATFRTCMLP